MKISDYVNLFKNNGITVETGCDMGAEVSYVSCNSKDVRPGTLFICKGAHFKKEYLEMAKNSGATIYMAAEKQDIDMDGIVVSDVRRAMALAADFYYDHAWNRLKLVGITGTKGKSTTAYFVKYILDEAMGSQTAIASSIDTYDGVESFESHLTTPEPLDLHRHFHNATSSGIEHFTMEVSSQALKYDRVRGVSFTVGCFLNISPDHISPIEHPDFEDYFGSKLRLFDQCRTAVVNLDCDHADEVLAAAKASERVITFSRERADADVFAYGIHKKGSSTVFMVKTADFDLEFTLTIPGLFNVENALAAIGISIALGIEPRHMVSGLSKARSKGRMEVYESKNGEITVIVDYAHNKLSFENLFSSVTKEYQGRRIAAVFGCPGNKAFDRRRELPLIAGQVADKVYITEEDPGEEPVAQISAEIAENIKTTGCEYEIIDDRGEAIRRAIMDSHEPTVVLLTGKGDETRQKRGTEYIDCPSDVEYTKKFLAEYDSDK